MYCSKCGKELKNDEKFCSGCGTAVGTTVAAAPQNLTLPSSRYAELDQKQFYGNEAYATNLRDRGGFGWFLLGLILTGLSWIIGVILYFVWKRDYPNRARSVLRGIFCGIIAYILIFVIFRDKIADWMQSQTNRGA